MSNNREDLFRLDLTLVFCDLDQMLQIKDRRITIRVLVKNVRASLSLVIDKLAETILETFANHILCFKEEDFLNGQN